MPKHDSQQPEPLREYFLVRHTTTGEYLAGLEQSGQLRWSADPSSSFRCLLMETVSHNLRRVREYYGIKDVEVVPVLYRRNPRAPGSWIPDLV